jgi:hypothetical protein
MPICDRCQAINLVEICKRSIPPNPKTLAPGWVHHDSYAALRSSAVNCPLCALFFEASNADPRYPQKPPIREDDYVKLFAITGEQWPRASPTNRQVRSVISLSGLHVQVGSKYENSISYYKYLDVWTDYSECHHLPAKSFFLTQLIRASR